MMRILCLWGVIIGAGLWAPPTGADVTQKLREQASIDAYTLYDQCKKGSLKRRHDCECIKQRVYEEQMAKGFTQPSDALIETILPECPNTPQMAAAHYTECVNGMGRNRPDREQFCTCYGNTLARLDARFGETPGLKREGLFALALKRCRFNRID